MRASVLLDAHAPARTAPAAIGGLVPLPGLRGYFESDGEYGSEPLDARRVEGMAGGRRWRTRRGGSRVRLLEHLRIGIYD